jgi:YVTN family beta-propeller protein
MPQPKTPAPANPATPSGPRIYVSNEDSGDVSIIDVAEDKEVGRISVGKRPRGLRLSADRARLYVAVSGSPKAAPGIDEKTLPPADHSADGIAEVDLRTGKLLRTLTAGSDPEAFDLSPDGSELYASNEDSGTLGVVDIAAGKPVASVPVGDEPEGVTTRPDGAIVYVTSEEDHRVDVVDCRARKVVAQIKTGLRPRAVVFTKDGSVAVVSNELSGSVSFLDAQKHRAKNELKLGIAEARPMGLAFSPDDKRLFVATGRGRGVVEIDMAEARVVRALADVGTRPWGIAITSDGKKLYTANGPANDVSVIDVASGKVIAHIDVGRSPWTTLYADPP